MGFWKTGSGSGQEELLKFDEALQEPFALSKLDV